MIYKMENSIVIVSTPGLDAIKHNYCRNALNKQALFQNNVRDGRKSEMDNQFNLNDFN